MPTARRRSSTTTCGCSSPSGTRRSPACASASTACSPRWRAADQPGAEVAVGKLVGASTTQDIAAFGLDLLGARGRALDAGDEATRSFHTMFSFGAIHRLEGGTDEVLRNILAERALGLPAELRADRGPFKDVPMAPSLA